MDDNKSEKTSLKIIEWNINCCKITSEKHKKWAKIAHCINEINPDILVLTECGESFNCDNFKQLLDDSSNWDIQVNKDDKHIDDNYNFIAILVNKKNFKKIKIERLDFQKDFCEEDFCEGNKRAKIHPDRIAVKITLNNTDITILGVRLLTGWGQVAPKNVYEKKMSTRQKQIIQNAQFIHDIEHINPDIIIGDFNTHSEMEKPKIYKIPWSSHKKNMPFPNMWYTFINSFDPSALTVFCQIISKDAKTYNYWPPKDRFISYRGTSPDTIVWNSNKISLSESSEDNKNPKYYPKIAQKQKLSDVVKDWPSDHCMLIADIEILS